MADDVRASQARKAHEASKKADQQAAQARTTRDNLILALRADDPAKWTHGRLATVVGCSPELVASICRRVRP